MSVQAVAFDMDGVLIDAVRWHYEALNEALRIFGAEISELEHTQRFDGLPTKMKLGLLNTDGRLPSHIHPIVSAVKQERTLRKAAELCFPKVEHLLMMQWLKSQGFPVGVVTNSIRTTSEMMLTYAGLLPLLDFLITNEDVAKPKPDPEGYLMAARVAGVEPAALLVVEDNEYGVQAATRAGGRVVRVSGPDDVNRGLLEVHL